jgi:glycosyltransferase involved in cell wall biosynthesis
LLKDIFPQNAVDLKLIKNNGVLHRIFLKKERKLYQISDTIGCMSEANEHYIIKHNKSIDVSKVEINPNSILPQEHYKKTDEFKIALRKKYNIPLGKYIYIYGGNLGYPQGIDFLLNTIAHTTNKDVFFLIVGSGTEYPKVNNWFKINKPQNAHLLSLLPKEDYDNLLNICDVGLIFLNKLFTIPNFPSRLLSYLEMKLPVIAATDVNTDIGKVIEDYNCGLWVESGNISRMIDVIDKMIIDKNQLEIMKENAWKLLIDKYHVSRSFELINEKLKNV